MTNDDLHYKTCREMAGLTQEDAAPLLGCSVRTLQRYESGQGDEANVPFDILARMCKTYNAPLLAWWHIKHRTEIGQFFPDVQVTQTPVDMGFYVHLVNRSTSDLLERMSILLLDGKITPDEIPDLKACIPHMESVTRRMVSTTQYAKSLVNDASD